MGRTQTMASGVTGKIRLTGHDIGRRKKPCIIDRTFHSLCQIERTQCEAKSYYFYRIQTHPSLSLRMSCSNRLHTDNSEKPLRLPARIAETIIKTGFQTTLSDNITERRQTLLNQATERNLGYFEEEVQKLDDWADDLKQNLEQDIKETDREIKEVRRTAATSATLEEKLSWQKKQLELENKRSRQRRELFDKQDEIEEQRNQLIEELEESLKQKVEEEELFFIEWEIN